MSSDTRDLFFGTTHQADEMCERYTRPSTICVSGFHHVSMVMSICHKTLTPCCSLNSNSIERKPYGRWDGSAHISRSLIEIRSVYNQIFQTLSARTSSYQLRQFHVPAPSRSRVSPCFALLAITTVLIPLQFASCIAICPVIVEADGMSVEALNL